MLFLLWRLLNDSPTTYGCLEALRAGSSYLTRVRLPEEVTGVRRSIAQQ